MPEGTEATIGERSSADGEGWSLARPDRTPEEEHAELADAFERARHGHPGLCRSNTFLFADRPARIRVTGPELAGHIERAFKHLRIDHTDATPELTIDLWDQAATGVTVEGLKAGPDLNAHGKTFVSANGRVVVTARTQTRTALDRKAQHLVGWVGRSADLTQYEIGRPLHSELILWHRDRGAQAIHAGLVAKEGQGVLFGGPGGAGKTTTALTSLKTGFEYLADDYVALEPESDGSFMGHSLYCSTHLEPEHLKRFPYLIPHATAGTLEREDKYLVMLSDVLPQGLSRKARIRAVALPRVTDSNDTTIEEATTIESMLRLAPSSLILLPFTGVGGSDFEGLADFLQRVPTYWINLGRELEQIPLRIGEILELHT